MNHHCPFGPVSIQSSMAENFDDYDVGDNAILISELTQELSSDGFDCASVDVLLRMARSVMIYRGSPCV